MQTHSKDPPYDFDLYATPKTYADIQESLCDDFPLFTTFMRDIFPHIPTTFYNFSVVKMFTSVNNLKPEN